MSLSKRKEAYYISGLPLPKLHNIYGKYSITRWVNLQQDFPVLLLKCQSA